ncbi:MAG: InlB B-repeat-containing protein [Chitinivibrionales bacterium]|nr:InlB B-repeat-containing protein [Chitinivibrionales bacterium]
MKKHSAIRKIGPAIFLLAAANCIFAFTAHVQTPAGSAISGVAVTFSGMDTTVYSDANGNVTLTIASAARVGENVSSPAWLRLANKRISLYLPASEKVDLHLYTLSGRQLFAKSGLLEKGPHAMPLPPMAQGIYVLKAVVGNKSLVRKISSYSVCQWSEGSQSIAGMSKLAKKAMVSDSATFAKAGYGTVQRVFANYGDNLGNVFMDTSISNLVPVSAVSAGANHTMILKQDGTLWATKSGQFVDGVNNVQDTIVKVMNGVLAVSAGSGYTMIIKQDNTLWATGQNSYGQLGIGDTISKKLPVQVMGSVWTVSAGQGHTMILKQDSTLWAVGYNCFGQLGDGKDINRILPVLVMTGVKAVSAGGNHTLVLKQDGTLWAMGENYYGQLGDGTNIEKHSPVQIMSEVSTVSTGSNHSMIIKQDGTLWVTGSNGYGQLGDGTNIEKHYPVQILSGIIAVSAGEYHSLILKQDHTLWTSGANNYGQLGTGDGTARFTPMRIMAEIAAISAGSYFTMILKNDGTLWATGQTDNCQLGYNADFSEISPRQVLPLLYNGLTVSGGKGSGSYLPGTYITISPNDSSATHKAFDHWSGSNGVGVPYNNRILMPNQAALVTAIYHDLHLLTITSGSGTGWYDSGTVVTITAYDSTAANRGFTHWGGPDSSLVSLITVKTSTLKMLKKAVQIKAVYGDFHTLSVLNGSGSGYYSAQSSIQIKADDSTIAKRYFHHWGGPDSNFVLWNNQNPSTFTMPDRAATIKGVYADLHALVINGGSGSGSFVPDYGVWISANDSTSAKRAFDHWGGQDSALVAVSSLMATTFIMPNKAASITAVYHDMYSLTVTNGTGSGWYDKGKAITITANNPTVLKTIFGYWGGPDSAFVKNDTSKSTVYSMPSRNAAITAVYVNGYTITYDKNGGDVDASPQQSGLVASGRPIVSLPTPPLRKGYCFTGYNLEPAGTGALFSNTSIVVGDITVYAQWVKVLSAAVAISAGDRNTMFIGQNGDLWGTGENFDGSLGANPNKKYSTPVLITTGVINVSSGTFHTMILKQDKTLWACGDNNYGQFGYGTPLWEFIPVQVMSGVSAVSAGDGYTMILKENGSLWATGQNDYGQLGDGTTTNKSIPIQIMSGVSAVSAGIRSTMILKQDGTLWAMGINNYGQLGTGDTLDRSSPVQVMSGVSGVSVGGGYSMIIKQDSTLWATGWNRYGQLGDGTTVSKATPMQVMSGVLVVSAGGSHTMIIKKDGTLWATGNNEYGQLGDKTTADKYSPVYLNAMGRVLSVATGNGFSVFMKQDGTVWAMGANYTGQLGVGDTINRYSPVQIMPLP